ncbi:hypothetical protein HUU05_04120 [candidate division KSB1 bacterium]|nr:hypothetical protein [candidate division KSB1 bacterium]
MSAVGLCEFCRHAQIIQSKRGGTFYLCRRSNDDSSFDKYPRLPVLSCRGYEAGEVQQHLGGIPSAKINKA